MSHYFYVTPEEYAEAAIIGVDPQSLDRRIRELGWKKEKAMSTPLGKSTDRRYWADVAKQNSIKYQTFMSRVNYYGYSEERAATEPPQDKRESARIMTERRKRKYPKKYVDLARQNGIAYHTFRARIIYGWDMEKAATHRIMSRSEAGKIGKKRTLEKYGDWNRFSFPH